MDGRTLVKEILRNTAFSEEELCNTIPTFKNSDNRKDIHDIILSAIAELIYSDMPNQISDYLPECLSDIQTRKTGYKNSPAMIWIGTYILSNSLPVCAILINSIDAY